MNNQYDLLKRIIILALLWTALFWAATLAAGLESRLTPVLDSCTFTGEK